MPVLELTASQSEVNIIILCFLLLRSAHNVGHFALECDVRFLIAGARTRGTSDVIEVVSGLTTRLSS